MLAVDRQRERIVLVRRPVGFNLFPLTDTVLPANIRVDQAVSTAQEQHETMLATQSGTLRCFANRYLIEGEEMTPFSQDVSIKQTAAVSKAATPSPVFWKAGPIVEAAPPEPKSATPDLRDFFAAAALQGLLSRDAGRNVSTIADYESKRAISAYRLADEMLKAR